ncbi:hypothetical protein L227DRAFT_588630 [Lentinus tigrinus ALCF2SS1-6]|uniref:SH3 domain-containing protein n=2 Tax=Lentinus tigrinus TaxID=5365 RepID=A0A5C2RWY4_9APHY|nr:hypothetical protein L227DRAFT_588630 [Lentinus tigrinus ALCF2SS1-6]
MSVVAQDSAELRLTLPVERASTSPFPSPGSPFYPPPRLGAHEFASRSSSSRSLNSNALPARDRDRDANGKPVMPHADGAVTPTAIPATPSLSVTTTAATPTTPTPGSVFSVKTPTTQITVPDPPPNSDAPVSLNAAAAALTSSNRDSLGPSNRDSLTSSRPAPPSPALSRRTSAALSRHSSTARSRRQSRASFLQASSHEPEASSSSTTTVSPQSKRRSLLFRIRDFAFPASDDRHIGKGPDVPRANRPRRRWSTFSAASVSSAGSAQAEETEEEGGAGGWGSYRWNTLSTHFSWGPGQGQQGAGGPSQTDLERNFAASSPTDENGDPLDDEDYDEYEDAQQDGDDETLVPGLYRALYAFEPEGTAEMALEEEQVVHVVGRGGGVGWAVVEKEGGGHALVPESYLELVEAD